MTQKASPPSQSLKKLMKMRARMTWIISMILCTLMGGNMLLMSTFADIGSRPIADGSPISLALIYSIGIVIIGVCISAFYIFWANRVLDKMVDAARKDLSSGGPS